MTPTLRQLGIDRLTPQERLELIGVIWDSCNQGRDIEVPDAHREELDRRLDAAKDGVEGGVSWDELRRSIEQKKS